jgi:hypothetical protein
MSMNDELKERLWKAADRYVGQDMSYTVVKVLLGEIEAAGYSVVPTEDWEAWVALTTAPEDE